MRLSDGVSRSRSLPPAHRAENLRHRCDGHRQVQLGEPPATTGAPPLPHARSRAEIFLTKFEKLRPVIIDLAHKAVRQRPPGPVKNLAGRVHRSRRPHLLTTTFAVCPVDILDLTQQAPADPSANRGGIHAKPSRSLSYRDARRRNVNPLAKLLQRTAIKPNLQMLRMVRMLSPGHGLHRQPSVVRTDHQAPTAQMEGGDFIHPRRGGALGVFHGDFLFPGPAKLPVQMVVAHTWG